MFKIDNEFKSLIPALTEDERKQLKANIESEGVRDPLVIWHEELLLIDGHNRYEIAKELGIPMAELQTEEISFADRNAVKLWIIDNQFGRRNLTDFVKYELLQVKKEILLAEGEQKKKETLKQGDKKPDLSIIDKTGKQHNTEGFKK